MAVMRQAGRGESPACASPSATADVTGIQANTGGFLTVLAGLLLVLPGFLTDLIGAVLLIRPVRRWCGGVPPRGCAAPTAATARRDRSRAGRVAARAGPSVRDKIPAIAS